MYARRVMDTETQVQTLWYIMTARALNRKAKNATLMHKNSHLKDLDAYLTQIAERYPTACKQTKQGTRSGKACTRSPDGKHQLPHER